MSFAQNIFVGSPVLSERASSAGDRSDADLDRWNPQILDDARHDRRVRMRRAVVCVAEVRVSVDLQDTHVVKSFGVSFDDRGGNRMLAAEHADKFV